MTAGDAHHLSVYQLPIQLVTVIHGKDSTCRLKGVSLTCEGNLMHTFFIFLAVFSRMIADFTSRIYTFLSQRVLEVSLYS